MFISVETNETSTRNKLRLFRVLVSFVSTEINIKMSYV